MNDYLLGLERLKSRRIRADVGYYLLINFYLVTLPFIQTTSLYCVNLRVPEATPTNFLPRCSTDVPKYYFSQRIVKIWNVLIFASRH